MSACVAVGCSLDATRISRCPEHAREYERAWRANHPGYMREYQRRRTGYYERAVCQEPGCRKSPERVGVCRNHAGRISEQRICRGCGAYFLTSRRLQVFCSVGCGKRTRAGHVGRASQLRCELGCHAAPRAEGLCAKHAPVALDYRDCLRCGDLFVVKAGNRLRRFCSARCAQLRANVDSRHRLRTATRSGDRIYPRQVFFRDGWRCQLCRRRIHAHLASPHPGSATIDHIIPLSQGGEHVWTNVQAAHRRCNTSKNRYVFGDGEQLRLIA